jgi:hypothetical protein
MLPTQRKSLCVPREVANSRRFAFIRRNANESASFMARCDNGRTNAGLDIIAGYGRNCGKQSRPDATGAVLSKDDPVSCAIRENIRKSDGVYANAVTDPNGAKEIDCYV